MSTWLRRAGFALAILILVGTVLNASWLAPDPVGAPKIIAHRGLAQDFDRAGVERDTCTATRIEPPYHPYLENTRPGILRAAKLEVPMIEVDIAPTSDGELVLFHDWTLDCRTDGTGEVRDATLAELKALDAGHGYTADGGATYPFRGQAIGAIPTLEEVLPALPKRTRIMFNFKSGDAAEARLLAEKLRALGRDPVAKRDAFYGHPDPVAAISAEFPEAWSWSPAGARRCSRDYVLYGWSGLLPESCKAATMVIPLNYQWAFWGWPNRLIARMEAHGGEVIVTGPYVSGEANTGLTLPEQLGEIPDSFNGYIWAEDAWTLQPALNPSRDNRSAQEQQAALEALARRRERQ